MINRSMSALRRRAVEVRLLGRLSRLRERHSEVPEVEGEIWQAVAALPKRQAQVIALMFVDDLTVTEIAAVLECEENTVRTHLRRAAKAWPRSSVWKTRKDHDEPRRSSPRSGGITRTERTRRSRPSRASSAGPATPNDRGHRRGRCHGRRHVRGSLDDGDRDRVIVQNPGPTSTTLAPTTTTTTPRTPPVTERSEVTVYLVANEHVVAAGARGCGSRDARSCRASAPRRARGAIESDLGFSSAIPSGSDVHSVTVDGSVATVDLTRQFEIGPSSLSMRRALRRSCSR